MKVLCQNKSYGAKKFIKEFSNKSWSLSLLKNLPTQTAALWISNQEVVKSVVSDLLTMLI